MEPINPYHTAISDIEEANDDYTPLQDRSAVAGDDPPPSRRRSLKGLAVIIVSVVFLVSLVALLINVNHTQEPSSTTVQAQNDMSSSTIHKMSFREPRGVAEGVSAKSNPFLLDELSYNWTNAMFSWQRTAFHFQPQKNWMNGMYNQD